MYPSAKPLSRPTEHPPAPPPQLSSRQLLRGRRSVVIEHGESRYTLLLTRNDKLILVK
jgi:hemin uptake protein HemP